MSVVFHVHKKRTQYAHDMTINFIASELPEISGVPFVTDGEENMIKAISKNL